HALRRDPPAVERPARRHEPRRTAPRAPRVREAAEPGVSVLSAALDAAARLNRLGASAARLCERRRGCRREAGAGSFLHETPVAAARSADSLEDTAHRGAAAGRLAAPAGLGSEADPA